MIKQCQQCGTDFETKAHNAKWCPNCRHAHHKEKSRCHYQKNKESELARANQYYFEHREQCLARSKRYVTEHREQHLSRCKKWRVSHPDYLVRWHTDHPEKVKEYNCRSNERRRLISAQRRRQRIIEAKKLNFAQSYKPPPLNVKPSASIMTIFTPRRVYSTALEFRFHLV